MHTSFIFESTEKHFNDNKSKYVNLNSENGSVSLKKELVCAYGLQRLSFLVSSETDPARKRLKRAGELTFIRIRILLRSVARLMPQPEFNPGNGRKRK